MLVSLLAGADPVVALSKVLSAIVSLGDRHDPQTARAEEISEPAAQEKLVEQF